MDYEFEDKLMKLIQDWLDEKDNTDEATEAVISALELRLMAMSE